MATKTVLLKGHGIREFSHSSRGTEPVLPTLKDNPPLGACDPKLELQVRVGQGNPNAGHDQRGRCQQERYLSRARGLQIQGPSGDTVACDGARIPRTTECFDFSAAWACFSMRSCSCRCWLAPLPSRRYRCCSCFAGSAHPLAPAAARALR